MSEDFFIGAFLVIIIMGLVGFGGYAYYVNYTYERDIGAYFDNARDCITPECILIQLDAGKQAIIDSGLTEDMYGALIFKKADNSMKFQYQHINSIIERVKAVAIWVNQTQNNGQIETMKDVYNEKMDNLRNYIHAEGYRSDWIAKDAWLIKNHPILYISHPPLVIIICILLIVLWLMGGRY